MFYHPPRKIFVLYHSKRAGASPRPTLDILLEVTLQQALQSHAVAGLIASHLMDGVVDGIQAVLA